MCDEIIKDSTTPSGFRVITYFTPYYIGGYYTVAYAPNGRVMRTSTNRTRDYALRAHEREVNAY
jgi:hypothetical protein